MEQPRGEIFAEGRVGNFHANKRSSRSWRRRVSDHGGELDSKGCENCEICQVTITSTQQAGWHPAKTELGESTHYFFSRTRFSAEQRRSIEEKESYLQPSVTRDIREMNCVVENVHKPKKLSSFFFRGETQWSMRAYHVAINWQTKCLISCNTPHFTRLFVAKWNEWNLIKSKSSPSLLALTTGMMTTKMREHFHPEKTNLVEK